MSTVAIELTDINKYFGNVCANKDVSLKIESGTNNTVYGSRLNLKRNGFVSADVTKIFINIS
jgi:hypothetical protein